MVRSLFGSEGRAAPLKLSIFFIKSYFEESSSEETLAFVSFKTSIKSSFATFFSFFQYSHLDRLTEAAGFLLCCDISGAVDIAAV